MTAHIRCQELSNTLISEHTMHKIMTSLAIVTLQLNFYCQDREVNNKTIYSIAEIIKRVSKWTQRFLCKRLLDRNTTVPKCVSLLVKYVVCISAKNTFSGGP